MACPLEGFVGRRFRLSKSVINYSSVDQHLAVPWVEDTFEGRETDTLLHKLDISSCSLSKEPQVAVSSVRFSMATQDEHGARLRGTHREK
jgi:hypothetical protein